MNNDDKYIFVTKLKNKSNVLLHYSISENENSFYITRFISRCLYINYCILIWSYSLKTKALLFRTNWGKHFVIMVIFYSQQCNLQRNDSLFLYWELDCTMSWLSSNVTFLTSKCLLAFLLAIFFCLIAFSSWVLFGPKSFIRVSRNLLPVIDIIIRFKDALKPCKKWFRDINIETHVGIWK